MKHEDVKAKILKDPEAKREYDALQVVQDIRRELIRLRIEKGITQKELAALAGERPAVIAGIERGTKDPSVGTLDRIAKALGHELRIRFDLSPALAAEKLADLTKQFDALLDSMQTPEAKAGMRKFFYATPEELGKAAVEAVKKPRRS